MEKKLLVLIGNANTDNPAEIGIPFFQAMVAASMGYRSEVILSGQTAQLACVGVAEESLPKEDSPKTLYDFIRDAHEAGVQIKVCTGTLELVGGEFIDEIEETVSDSYVISEAMADNVVTFTY